MGNAHAAGDVDQTSLTVNPNEIIDELDVVFRGFGLVGFTNLGETRGLLMRFWQLVSSLQTVVFLTYVILTLIFMVLFGDPG